MAHFKNWVMQNHHLTSISTSPQFFARQIFYPAEPISEYIQYAVTLHRRQRCVHSISQQSYCYTHYITNHRTALLQSVLITTVHGSVPNTATVTPLQCKYSMTHSIGQFCAYTQDRDSLRLAFDLIKRYNFKFEAHINRTRFWVPTDHPKYSYIALRFTNVDRESDHSLGI